MTSLLKDAEAVCKGQAQLKRLYQPKQGENWDDQLVGKMHHRALLSAVLLYLEFKLIPSLLKELGDTTEYSPKHIRHIALKMREKILVDEFE